MPRVAARGIIQVALALFSKELRVEELGKRHAEAFGYLLQVDRGHVALAGLHFAEVGARHAYEIGELLLAHPALGTQLLDVYKRQPLGWWILRRMPE